MVSSASTSTDQGPTRPQIDNNIPKFAQESDSGHSPSVRPVRPLNQRPPPKLFVKFWGLDFDLSKNTINGHISS